MPRTVAIVFGTYNRLGSLKLALASLPIGEPGYDVVVIDAGSDDGTVGFLRSVPGIRPVFQHELTGQTRAYNPVLRSVTADYVYLHADDAELRAGVLDDAIDVLEQRPEVGIVGLKMRDTSGAGAARDYMGGISEFGVLTCNHPVIRMSALRRVGYLCERYRSYGMDADLTAAVLLSGASVVLTRAVGVLHHRGWSPEDGSAAARTADAMHAAATYRERFGFLGAPLNWRVRRAILVRVALVLFRGARPGTKRFGLAERDWLNVAGARFVRIADPILHARDTYYFEQRVPRRFVTASANPVAAQAAA